MIQLQVKSESEKDLDPSGSSLSSSVGRAVLVEVVAVLGEVAVSLVTRVHADLGLQLVDDPNLVVPQHQQRSANEIGTEGTIT